MAKVEFSVFFSRISLVFCRLVLNRKERGRGCGVANFICFMFVHDVKKVPEGDFDFFQPKKNRFEASFLCIIPRSKCECFRSREGCMWWPIINSEDGAGKLIWKK